MLIHFTVYGEQRPAGSKRGIAYRKKGGGLGVRVIHDCKQTEPWMQQVAGVAHKAMAGLQPMTGPLFMSLTFGRPRPKGHFGKTGLTKQGRESTHPTSKPDLVKLTRAVEDALSGVVYGDDSQVCRHELRKLWSTDGEGHYTHVTVCLLSEVRDLVNEMMKGT